TSSTRPPDVPSSTLSTDRTTPRTGGVQWPPSAAPPHPARRTPPVRRRRVAGGASPARRRTVHLPSRLDRSGQPSYDLTERGNLIAMYQAVLNEATDRADLVRWLHGPTFAPAVAGLVVAAPPARTPAQTSRLLWTRSGVRSRWVELVRGFRSSGRHVRRTDSAGGRVSGGVVLAGWAGRGGHRREFRDRVGDRRGARPGRGPGGAGGPAGGSA